MNEQLEKLKIQLKDQYDSSVKYGRVQVEHHGDNTVVKQSVFIPYKPEDKERVFKKKKTIPKIDRKFIKTIYLTKNPKVKATQSQLKYIFRLLKDEQRGKINYNHVKHGRHLSKDNASKFIDLLESHYYDINFKFKK